MKYIPVRGLAKLILIDYACRSTHSRTILSGFNHRFEEAIKKEILKDLDIVKPSDYGEIAFHTNFDYTAVSYVFNRFDGRAKFFKELNSKKNPSWKPYYIYGMNNIEGIINDTMGSSNLGDKIEVSFNFIIINNHIVGYCQSWISKSWILPTNHLKLL